LEIRKDKEMGVSKKLIKGFQIGSALGFGLGLAFMTITFKYIHTHYKEESQFTFFVRGMNAYIS
jgi:hypothetical protein